MPRNKFPYIIIIFIAPFLLGVGILAYWYWTVRIEKKALLPNYGSVPEFSLTTEENKSFSRDQLMGKVTIADFIFTQCAGSCPVMTMKMGELQDTFKTVPDLNFVSFSVDPETDNPGVLTEYARNHNAIQGKWHFLTGSKKLIYSITKEGFHLGLDIEGTDAIIHSQKFVLIDGHAEIRGYYDSEDENAMKNLVQDARILVSKISL
jgi:protein SCO1/2